MGVDNDSIASVQGSLSSVQGSLSSVQERRTGKSWQGGLAAQPMPVLLTHAEHGLQVFKNASHALLQEADVNLAQLMKDVGFYVTQRHMSAPVTKRSKSSFGSASPIEKPTIGELDYY